MSAREPIAEPPPDQSLAALCDLSSPPVTGVPDVIKSVGRIRPSTQSVSLWTELGFRENPYSTTPIPPTKEGARLLVGRDKELKQLTRLLESSATHPTVEGDNGVGKTSLVGIAAYNLMHAAKPLTGAQLFIPLPDDFQITPQDDLESFRRHVYFVIARAFIENHKLLRSHDLAVPDVDDVRKWLQSPLLSDYSGGATVLGMGAQGGRTTTINDADGFSESGFQTTIDAWLRDCFPSPQTGAFIGVIDNLELLETSQKARALLEALRDSVLRRQGLRWVLCGARGIVRSSASSARLNGVLSEPIELGPISDNDIPSLVERRITVYSDAPNAYVPVEERGFHYVYHILNRNLRDALRYCESFSFWMDEEKEFPDKSQERFDLFETWLALEAEKSLKATSNVKPRAWRVFDDLATAGGSCSPSDFADFGFNSPMAFRAPVKTLEDANLVQSSKADSDQRRKTISVTARGWLVNHQRTGYANAPE